MKDLQPQALQPGMRTRGRKSQCAAPASAPASASAQHASRKPRARLLGEIDASDAPAHALPPRRARHGQAEEPAVAVPPGGRQSRMKLRTENAAAAEGDAPQQGPPAATAAIEQNDQHLQRRLKEVKAPCKAAASGRAKPPATPALSESGSEKDTATPTVQRRPSAGRTAFASGKPDIKGHTRSAKQATRRQATPDDSTDSLEDAALDSDSDQHDAETMSQAPTPRTRGGMSTRSSMGVVHLACTNVNAKVQQLARKAVQSLGKAVFYDSEADVAAATLTHLVVGGDTVSAKALLAAADAADIVKPTWLEQCLKERAWLPAGAHYAEVCTGMCTESNFALLQLLLL